MLWDKWIRGEVWSEGERRRVLSHSLEVWFGGGCIKWRRPLVGCCGMCGEARVANVEWSEVEAGFES